MGGPRTGNINDPVTRSNNFKPARLLEIVRDGNRRLHVEGKRRGLALTGRDDNE